MDKNILITGGAGFIGSHLTEALSLNNNITVLDDLSTGQLKYIKHIPRIKIIQKSLSDYDAVIKSLEGIDYVCHLAAIPSVLESINDPYKISATNVYDSVFLMHQAIKAGVKRFIISSSAAVYGDSKVIPATESLSIESLSPYAASKASIEQFARSFASCYNMDTVSLRYFNVYGPRQLASSPYSGVVTKMLNCLKNDEIFNVYGDGEQTRDYVHVSDIVKANICAIETSNRLNGLAINIGSGVPTSLNDLIDLIGLKKVEYQPERVGEIKHSLADISLADRLLNYKPSIDLKDGLGSLI